jgi:hypothetical protein
MAQPPRSKDPFSSRDPRSSQRKLQRYVLIGIALGVLFLFSLGIYGFWQFFNWGGLDATDSVDTLGTDIRDLTEADLQSTATAACGQFQSAFPGTPCPVWSVEEISATATASCEAFQIEFPGTPCP